MRGTLRYRGFCLLVRSLMELGLFSEDAIPNDVPKDNWRNLLAALVKDQTKKVSVYDEGIEIISLA